MPGSAPRFRLWLVHVPGANEQPQERNDPPEGKNKGEINVLSCAIFILAHHGGHTAQRSHGGFPYHTILMIQNLVYRLGVKGPARITAEPKFGECEASPCIRAQRSEAFQRNSHHATILVLKKAH